MNTDQAINRMREVARLRHLSYSTEKSYCTWLTRYCSWLAAHPAVGESRTKVEAFLTSLAKDDLSASSQNQAFCALLFFYRDCLDTELGRVDALRAKRAIRERYSPSIEEVNALLSNIRDSGGYPTRLVAYLLYGCGLRVTEPVSLRIKDVDLKESRLVIRQAKGNKDRVVPLPCSLVKLISSQIAYAKSVAAKDCEAGIPVQLPNHLDKKYPRLSFSHQWAFVFPGLSPCRHPRTGRIVRWHMLEQTVQRAFRECVRRMDLNPMITPHSLRHAWASHSMRAGASVRDIQVVMGHKSLETTMVYLHDEAGRVKSPLDRMNLSFAS